MSKVFNMVGGGGKNISSIVITGLESTDTVTCTKDGKSYTATWDETAQHWEIVGLPLGTFNLTATNGTDITTKTVFIDIAGVYEINCRYYDENTVFLVHGNALEDVSHYGNDILQYGTISPSTDKSKFQNSSLFFSNSYYFYANLNKQIAGDVTIECWIYQTGRKSYPTPLLLLNQAKENSMYGHLMSSSSVFSAYDKSGNSLEISTGALSLNEWHHLAYVIHGSEFLVFIDGNLIQSKSGYGTHLFNQVAVGSVAITNNDHSSAFDGYIDEVRVSDVARWTESFTPPSAPYES